MLPSMPKGETVGNIVIDGKGADQDQQRYKRTTRQRRQKCSETVTLKKL